MTATKFDEHGQIGYKPRSPRPTRYAPGGMVLHVLNRGVGRRVLFGKREDFLAFERVMQERLRVRPMRVCAYCLLSTHWHFVLWPENDGDLPTFMQQLTYTHVKRWKEHRHETKEGKTKRWAVTTHSS